MKQVTVPTDGYCHAAWVEHCLFLVVRLEGQNCTEEETFTYGYRAGYQAAVLKIETNKQE